MEFNGNVDVFGHCASLGGFLGFGWIDLNWNDTPEARKAFVQGSAGSATGEIHFAVFPREDVRKRGLGATFFLETDCAEIGSIVNLSIYEKEVTFKLLRSRQCQDLVEWQIFEHLKGVGGISIPAAIRSKLRRLLARPAYKGENTIANVSPNVKLEVDRVYLCPPSSYVLIGWFLDPFDEVKRMSVRWGGSAHEMDSARWIAIRRRDVRETFANRLPIMNDRIGFAAFVPDLHQARDEPYLEIELQDGRIGFRPVELGFFSGIPAINEFLGRLELRSEEVDAAFSYVVGPAIAAMNAFRLRLRPSETHFQYGAPLARPRATLIVPLYGRVDFMESQLALFSQGLGADIEIVYVLDDPDRLAETEALAASCYARFERSFTLIALSHNVGYAPANNIGLRYARGDYVCFLNSDVFPEKPDWLERMIETERSDTRIGVVGAVLVYEDESLQHRGCAFEPLPEFGNWMFVTHPDKGRRLMFATPQGEATAVTGACMVMRKEVAVELAGFDEGYVIGDFEDVDLCLRARERGYASVVDHRARLYHLERQSQGKTEIWRLNLTLYNAWRFQQRWRQHELCGS